jgi:hypothetical protein
MQTIGKVQLEHYDNAMSCLTMVIKFRPRYSHHGKLPVGLVEHVLTSSSTNIFLSTLCDPSQLMELEVTSIYSDTHDKSVTNQILGNAYTNQRPFSGPPIFFKKILVVLWVMVRVVMRFPSSALIHNKNNIISIFGTVFITIVRQDIALS